MSVLPTVGLLNSARRFGNAFMAWAGYRVEWEVGSAGPAYPVTGSPR
jgi:hypothetical protein